MRGVSVRERVEFGGEGKEKGEVRVEKDIEKIVEELFWF